MEQKRVLEMKKIEMKNNQQFFIMYSCDGHYNKVNQSPKKYIQSLLLKLTIFETSKWDAYHIEIWN